jgi:hypothetical protein
MSRNAELKEYIAAGVSRDDFMKRMKGALAAPQPAPPQLATAQPAPSQSLPAQAPQPQPEPVSAPAVPANQPSRSDASSTASSGQATPPSPTESRVQSFLAERAVKLAEKKKKDEEAARQQQAEKAKTKAEAEASGAKKPDEQSKHAAALRKKQREAREERERILKAIEDDKVARKAQRAETAAARRASVASEKAESAPFAPASPLIPTTGKLSEHCALQVRLFDGSTIRTRFSSSETLKDVRKWVDDERKDGKQAYTFKVLLTPLPSKTIDVTEEDKTLQALELAPSSTLILLRVPKFTAAYSSSARRPVADGPQGGGGGVFQRIIAYLLAIITGFFSTIAAFFSTLVSTSGPPEAPDSASARTSQSQAAADAAARRRGGRLGGVDHTETEGQRNDQQFYNGNSVSATPLSPLAKLYD